MRVKIHSHVETLGKTGENRKEIREEVHGIIYSQLVEFEKEIKLRLGFE
jgi:1-acyl-sn-glycerol-3-phosphate acyltransferase